MKVVTTQKIIRIGTSLGVTLPAKDLKRLAIGVGDEVEVTLHVPDTEKTKQLEELKTVYENFKLQYEQTLSKIEDR